MQILINGLPYHLYTGLHLEGPFISEEKKGAHPSQFIKQLDNGFQTVEETYKCLENVSIVTLAPELDNSCQVIKELTDGGIMVSVGRCYVFRHPNILVLFLLHLLKINL